LGAIALPIPVLGAPFTPDSDASGLSWGFLCAKELDSTDGKNKVVTKRRKIDKQVTRNRVIKVEDLITTSFLLALFDKDNYLQTTTVVYRCKKIH
jgi:hypothetical protein